MSRLLLRSTKSNLHRTRIDVLFQNVKNIFLPTELAGLSVSIAETVDEAVIVKQTGLLPDAETVFFRLETSNCWGFVVAGVVVETEDNGEYYEPSKYWPGGV